MYLLKVNPEKFYRADEKCPNCDEWFSIVEDFEDREEGEYDLCPYCKAPLKLTFDYTRRYDVGVCSKKEFEEETGEELEDLEACDGR